MAARNIHKCCNMEVLNYFKGQEKLCQREREDNTGWIGDEGKREIGKCKRVKALS